MKKKGKNAKKAGFSAWFLHNFINFNYL